MVAAAVPEAVPEAEAVPLLARVEVTTTLLAEGDAVTVTAVVLATEGMLAGGTEEAAEAAEEAAAEEEAEAEADMPEPAEAAAQSLSEAGRTWFRATSAPQAPTTQPVAAAWMADLLAGSQEQT